MMSATYQSIASPVAAADAGGSVSAALPGSALSYKSLLVNLEAGQPNTRLLQMAACLATRFQASLIGVTACTPIQLIYGDGYTGGQVFEQDRQEIEKEIDASEALFRGALGTQIADLDWRSAVTFMPLAEYLAGETRRADLVLMSAPSGKTTNNARQVNLGDFIMQAGRPVLVVAPEPSPLEPNRVLVAWQDTREARRAIADALPLLQLATCVRLVEIAPEAELATTTDHLSEVSAWLRRHNVTAECVPLISHGSAGWDDADGLKAVAEEWRADLIVAGAYGHSRVREWALGGMTRSLLGKFPSSVFLSH